MNIKSRIIPFIVSDPRRPEALVLRAVGDIMLIGRAAAELERRGFGYPFAPVAEIIQSADLAFGNLEMPIYSSSQATPYFPDVCPDFRSPPETAEALKSAGFDVLNLANNHIMDWGMAGLQETIAKLRAMGLQTVGAGQTLSEAREPAIFIRNGLRVAFLGYGVRGPWNASASRPGTALIDRALMMEDMGAVRDQVDLLIVSVHTGILSDYPNPEDRLLAKELIDHGADFVLSHGPHVLQGVELYKNAGIAHSLGNFIIDVSSGNVQLETAIQEHLESVILDVGLAREGVSRVSCIPILISESFQTIPAEPKDAVRISGRLKTISDDLDRMQGLALWQHAGGLTVVHEIRVLAFQARHVGWRHVLKRLKKIRWRHLRLLLGYLVVKTRKVVGQQLRARQPS